MVTQTDIFFPETETNQEVFTVASPVAEPFKVCTGFAEEFEFHLFKLTYTEDKVSGSNFVSERLSDLCNTERNFFSCSTLDICEVHEDTLCGFGTEIKFRLAVLCNTLKGLEHEIKLSYIRKVVFSAVGTYYFMLIYVIHHLLI